MTSDISCSLLEFDFSGIEAVLTGFYLYRHGFSSDGARQYIRLARLGIHSAVTSVAVNKPVDLSLPDDALKQALDAVKKAYPQDYDQNKRVVHGCVPGDHEVLTPRGWVRFDQLNDDDRVAQWWPDRRIEFVRPSHVTRTHYTGRLHEWYGRGLHIQMTPTHRVPVITNDTLHLGRTAEAPGSEYSRIPVTGTLQASSSPTAVVSLSLAQIQLAAAVQADGCWQGNRVRFHLHRPRKIKRLKALLHDANIDAVWHVCNDGRGKRCDMKIGALEGVRQLLAFQIRPSTVTKEKWWHLPALLQLYPSQRAALLEEVAHWDGTRKSAGYQGVYLSVDPRNTRAIQTLAHVTGHQSLHREPYVCQMTLGRAPYRASLSDRTEVRLSSLRKSLVPHDGMVYCVTVPSSWFLVRYRGSISVTGNSNFGMSEYGLVEKFPEYFKDINAARARLKFYYTLAPDLPKWHHALRKQARDHGYLGGITKPNAVPSIWDSPYGYRHWFWDVQNFQPCNEFMARKWLKDPLRAHRIVYLHGRPFKVQPGGDSNRTIAFYPQSTAAGRLKEVENRLFLPWSDDYIGDCYFGRTPLLGPIHDSLLLHVPNRCVDRVTEIVARVMQEPSAHLPIPVEWGWGGYLPIGVAAKIGSNWGEMEDLPIEAWVPSAGADAPVLPRESEGEFDDWAELSRSVA